MVEKQCDASSQSKLCSGASHCSSANVLPCSVRYVTHTGLRGASGVQPRVVRRYWPPSHNKSFNRNPRHCSRLRWHRGNIRFRTDPRRVRLTPALGGRKAFGGFAVQRCEFFGFGQHCSSDKFSALSASVTSLGALIHCVRYVGRLRKRCLVWSVFPQLTQPLRLHPAESSWVRVRAFPLRLSASSLGSGLYRHPPPPNNSFKPTPCRGVGHVLYATLAHVRRPATGRLNSGVIRQRVSFPRSDTGIEVRLS